MPSVALSCSKNIWDICYLVSNRFHMAPRRRSAVSCFGSGDLFSFSCAVAWVFSEQLIQDAATILLFTSTPRSLITVFQGSSWEFLSARGKFLPYCVYVGLSRKCLTTTMIRPEHWEHSVPYSRTRSSTPDMSRSLSFWSLAGTRTRNPPLLLWARFSVAD